MTKNGQIICVFASTKVGTYIGQYSHFWRRYPIIKVRQVKAQASVKVRSKSKWCSFEVAAIHMITV